MWNLIGSLKLIPDLWETRPSVLVPHSWECHCSASQTAATYKNMYINLYKVYTGTQNTVKVC